MERSVAQSSETLLARINHQLEVISEAQHRLARRKLTLQEQATRLRLGASPAEVRQILKDAAAAERSDQRPWSASDWSIVSAWGTLRAKGSRAEPT